MPSVKPDEVGDLYLIRSSGQHAVKVGFARSVVGRLSMLQTGNPCKLELMETVACTLSAEKRLHQLLKPLRIAREWYPDSTFFDLLIGEFVERLWERADEFDDPRTAFEDQYVVEADVSEAVTTAFRLFAFDEEADDGTWRTEIDQRLTEIVVSVLPAHQRSRPEGC